MKRGKATGGHVWLLIQFCERAALTWWPTGIKGVRLWYDDGCFFGHGRKCRVQRILQLHWLIYADRDENDPWDDCQGEKRVPVLITQKLIIFLEMRCLYEWNLYAAPATPEYLQRNDGTHSIDGGVWKNGFVSWFCPQINSEVTGRLKEATQEFKAKLPVIVELGNPAMKPRHWQKLFKVSSGIATMLWCRHNIG